MTKKIKIEVSARHVHLTKEDFEKLFGKGAQMTIKKELSQPGMFAANETVAIKDEYFRFDNVRIVGPIRSYTQVELSMTDARNFKINPPLKVSGDIGDTPGIIIAGPKGEIKIEHGVVIAKRHIHMTNKEAKELNAKNGDLLKVKTAGERGLVFENVAARVDDSFAFAMHIDTDEGNAAGIAGYCDGEVMLNC